MPVRGLKRTSEWIEIPGSDEADIRDNAINQNDYDIDFDVHMK